MLSFNHQQDSKPPDSQPETLQRQSQEHETVSDGAATVEKNKGRERKMSEKNLVNIIESLREWESLQEEAAAMVESLKDQIKAEMTARNVEELEAGQYVARFTTVQSSRFDTKRFKQELGEQLYKSYCKETISRRFTIA